MRPVFHLQEAEATTTMIREAACGEQAKGLNLHLWVTSLVSAVLSSWVRPSIDSNSVGF